MPIKSKDKFLFPFSSFTGSRLINFLRISLSSGIDRKYLGRYLLSLIICIILEPFRWINKLVRLPRKNDKEMDHQPWFIIGFWRSGTTLMHQLLSEDKRFYYVTTYQTIFPELMIYQKVLKWLAGFFVPDRRPVDNMRLTLDDAQEEEIALANIFPESFYHFLYFPRYYKRIRDRSLYTAKYRPGRISYWKKMYSMVISEARRNVGGEIFLSKNPSSTFRIKELLEMYPEAKFIFLERDPYQVLSSFRLFMQQVVRGVGFQRVDDQQFNEYMVDLYLNLHEAYKSQKDLIPEQNLYEVDFKQFTTDPYNMIDRIYQQFGVPIDGEVKDQINKKLAEFANHSSGAYTIPQDVIDLVDENLKEFTENTAS